VRRYGWYGLGALDVSSGGVTRDECCGKWWAKEKKVWVVCSQGSGFTEVGGSEIRYVAEGRDLLRLLDVHVRSSFDRVPSAVKASFRSILYSRRPAYYEKIGQGSGERERIGPVLEGSDWQPNASENLGQKNGNAF